MDFVLITGMSGSGKSRAIAAMEDIGYYCVDNLPPKMVRSFVDLCAQADDKIDKVAIVIDARSKEIFGDLFDGLEEFVGVAGGFQTLFLDCDDSILVQRYKETRRKHPLMDQENPTVEGAISEERRLLSKIRDNADYIIDTTYLSVNQLREKVVDIFLDDRNQSMLVNCMSFGFKYGLPKEADLVFDVRCLPNPFYVPELKMKTGLEAPVREYVMQWKQTRQLVPKLLDLLDYLLPLYRDEGKTQLTIAIGCTGGKHRSVVFAQLLADHVRDQGIRCTVSHRDISKHKE
ncbi:RNase adapter RapZ [Marasmitruncus massiliensis]|uniref:RNase adapter RapZ n=1 Tax=Marasmitruncus massiliensis TaxID=1944642 RepID=UPI000C7D26B4|nr:RNase adapter RapZ [Marasmitruncus massiliensis]